MHTRIHTQDTDASKTIKKQHVWKHRRSAHGAHCTCRMCVDQRRLRGLHNASGQCRCPPPLQRDDPRGEHGKPGRPAIRAPPFKTHGPTCYRSPARTHAALQRARVWNRGTKAQGGREHDTPAKTAHPLAVCVHEGHARPTAQASRPRAASKARPRRVADASPLPVEPCTNARSSAAGTRTGRAILDGPRMSTTTTSARRVCVPADARARGQTTAHSHAQQLRVRSGQRTHRVWLCAITRKKTARARRGRNAHMHVAGRLPPCAPVCGTRARRRRAAGNTPPPQKQHTRWQPASMRAARARPRRRRGRARRPRRVADALPLPVDRCPLSGNRTFRCFGRKCNSRPNRRRSGSFGCCAAVRGRRKVSHKT